MNSSSDIYVKSIRNSLYGLIANGLTVLLSAMVMPLIVLKMGAEKWGVYSFFLLFIAILAFIESAVQVYGIQMVSHGRIMKIGYFWRRDKGVVGILKVLSVIAVFLACIVLL